MVIYYIGLNREITRPEQARVGECFDAVYAPIPGAAPDSPQADWCKIRYRVALRQNFEGMEYRVYEVLRRRRLEPDEAAYYEALREQARQDAPAPTLEPA